MKGIVWSTRLLFKIIISQQVFLSHSMELKLNENNTTSYFIGGQMEREAIFFLSI